jgi:metal-sulfur cluster biosynthetic enzyme
MVTQESVLKVLEAIKDPCSISAGCELSIVEMGLITGVKVAQDAVSVELRVTSPGCVFGVVFAKEIQERLHTLDGVEVVEVDLTDGWQDWTTSDIKLESRARLADARKARLAEIHELTSRREVQA